MKTLSCHGNIDGRNAMLAILEAGLQASDPYNNTRKLIRRRNDELIVGNSEFEPHGSPESGDAVYDLSNIDRIFVFGAGKGIQRAAKALEDSLGDRITGGHVIDKKGHPVILDRIGVTLGSHPVPDEDCVKGCRRILNLTETLTEKDLVFTCISNGVSSTLTMPVPGVSLEAIRRMTYIMQVERGAPTSDLNQIRNQLDMMKGGRITRHIQPARAIHILVNDPGDYESLMSRNLWLHTMPDCTTSRTAIESLKKWDAWDAVDPSIRKFLETADPEYETVKAKEFKKWESRIFGVMPRTAQTGTFPPAIRMAKTLGFNPVVLTDNLMFVEALHAGKYLAAIARSIEKTGRPFEPPCALFTSGEMVVTVGEKNGIGGRNQEFTLSAAQGIAGSKNIVIASVDTDGTDGPGTQFSQSAEIFSCLAGGIVDGETVDEAMRAGIDIGKSLKDHNTSPVLLKLKSGIIASPNISLNDLTVALVTKRSG